MKHVSVIMVVAVALLGATAAFAQMELGTIQGTVRDESGQPIEDAIVRLVDSDRGLTVEVKTNGKGMFYRRGLQAVDYEFFVEKPGYNPIHDRLRVNAGLEKRYDFKLVKAAPAGAEEFAQGIAAFNAGDNAAAATAFEAAALKAPDLPEVHVNLALAYLRLSRPEDAVAELRKASALAPDDAKVLFQLGGAYVEMNTLDEAIAAFEKGMTLDSDISDQVVYEATITLGAAYFADGQNDQAKTEFEKALAAKPDDQTARLGLAKVYASEGDTARALELFRAVASAAPAGSAEATEASAFIAELEKR